MSWQDSRTPSPTATTFTCTNPTHPAVTYIPPLVDGASGTVSRAQKIPSTTLGRDAASLLLLLPSLVRACVVLTTSRLSWRDMTDATLHTVLAVLEVYMLLWAGPLFLLLPGLAFLCWLAACGAGAYMVRRALNRPCTREFSVGQADALGVVHDGEDDVWFYVAGMGASVHHLKKTTLPLLSRIFNRRVTAIHNATLGLPLDLLVLLLQRSNLMLAPITRLLHARLRTALLDASVGRVVVLAHNAGAATTASVVAQLCADLPQSTLAKLELYTFGAAAAELVVPLGGRDGDGPPTAPHIEHFAFADDPFARFGVLPAVREDLDGRLCGGVFIMSSSSSSLSTSPGTTCTPHGLAVEEYLSALFPQQGHARGVLDSLLLVDFETAEKRELAAIALHRGHHVERASWTWLGATAGQHDLAVHHGLHGLKQAREGCKQCAGHRGRELSRLASYVAAGKGA